MTGGMWHGVIPNPAKEAEDGSRGYVIWGYVGRVIVYSRVIEHGRLVSLFVLTYSRE